MHGTPTLAIARAAGISQACLFGLFPTKDELFNALNVLATLAADQVAEHWADVLLPCE